jgi:hypothetical protein
MSYYFVEAEDKSFVNFKAYDTCTALNDQKQIDRLLHECLIITGDILNKEYDEELIDVIEKLADKISKIRCFVNPVYKQICDDVEKAISESEEDTCHTY